LPDYDIEDVLFRDGGMTVPLSVLRLDKPDRVAGGNKSFKLRHNIAAFREGGYEAILSFGGPYSNHIAALAAVGRQSGIPVIGLIREGGPAGLSSVTLRRAAAQGMRLQVISRSEYRRIRESNDYSGLYQRFGHVWVIPEGGSNTEGIRGCGEIADLIPAEFNQVALAVGTGATLCGLRSVLPMDTRLLGVKVVEARQEQFIERRLGKQVTGQNGMLLQGDFVFGGYARPSPVLEEFLTRWYDQTGILSEPVYTGRLFYALVSLYCNGFFEKGSRVLAIHSGGLQYLSD